MGQIAGARLKALEEYMAKTQEREAFFREKMLPMVPQPKFYVPEEGVLMRSEFKKNKNAKHSRDGKYVNFATFDDLAMQDWDFPDEIHHASSVNIRHMGDAVDRINRFTHDNKGSNFRVYLTPGGVRSFDMTRRITPREFADRGYDEVLQVDPNYIKFAQDMIVPYQARDFYPEQGWSSRLSGKPGRDDDFVAYYLGSVGDGLPHPDNRRLVSQYHDIPIAKNIAKEGLNPLVIPDSKIDLLDQQLKTVDKSFAQKAKERLAKVGLYL